MDGLILLLIGLGLLAGPWTLAWAAGQLAWLGAAGRLGLALHFLATGQAHFTDFGRLRQMLPDGMPLRDPVIWASGAAEIIAALLILHPRTARPAGLAMIAMLVAFFPANIWSAWVALPYAGHGWGLWWLLPRIPYQILLIWWAWRFAVRASAVQRSR